MKESIYSYLNRPKAVPFAVAAAFFAVVATVVLEAESLWREPVGHQPPVVPDIAETLFTTYLGAFEAIAVLLVAALVAGVYLAKPEEPRSSRLEDTVDAKIRTDADTARESLERRRTDKEEEDSGS